MLLSFYLLAKCDLSLDAKQQEQRDESQLLTQSVGIGSLFFTLVLGHFVKDWSLLFEMSWKKGSSAFRKEKGTIIIIISIAYAVNVYMQTNMQLSLLFTAKQVSYFHRWGGPGCGSWAGRCCSSSVSCAGRHSCPPFVTWVWPVKGPKQTITNGSERCRKGGGKRGFCQASPIITGISVRALREFTNRKWHSPWASSRHLQVEVPLAKYIKKAIRYLHSIH